MKKILFVLPAVMVCLTTAAAETLEEKVIRLEKKIATLEKSQKPTLEKSQQLTLKEEAMQRILEEQKLKARDRASKDHKIYSKEELQEIERIYQSWRKKSGEEQKEVAYTLLEKYPKANRTGCAMLYLAQISSGNEQLEMLRQVIRNYNGCYYFDGAQVGAIARLHLFRILNRSGRRREAQRYRNELISSYPRAVAHNGQLIRDMLK